MRAPIGAEWNKLTDKTKCKWENLAAQNKVVYLLTVFENRHKFSRKSIKMGKTRKRRKISRKN